MSRLLPLALLLLAAPAVAAPVPKQVLSAEQEKEFDDLFDGADGRRSASIRQFCRLVQQPEAAVAYIVKNVKPAKLDEKEAKQLIADIASKDEATWRRACRDLCFRDVRLALTFSESWALATTDEHKLRLGLTLYGYSALGADATHTTFEVELPRRNGEKARVRCMYGKGKGIQTGWSQEVFETFDELVAHRKRNKQASDGDSVLVANSLERIRTPAALKHMGALADGHPDAYITREARAALDRLNEKRETPAVEMEKVWRRFVCPFTKVDTVITFLDRPKEAVAYLKANLRPVKVNADSAKKLLTRLLGDDKKQVRAALRELQVVDLALELNLKEEFEKLKTPEHRCRLAAAVGLWEVVPYGDITDAFDIDERMKEYDYTIGTSYSAGQSEYILWKKWREEAPGGGRRDDPREDHRTLCRTKDEIHPDRWYHEESAIYILDAIGTDDAIAVIKDMASGHADAGPTKAAKDVLKRRGLK